MKCKERRQGFWTRVTVFIFFDNKLSNKLINNKLNNDDLGQ